MPESNPGSLSRQEYIDILAYMLSLNRYSSGKEALLPSTEILSNITISARKKWLDCELLISNSAIVLSIY